MTETNTIKQAKICAEEIGALPFSSMTRDKVAAVVNKHFQTILRDIFEERGGVSRSAVLEAIECRLDSLQRYRRGSDSEDTQHGIGLGIWEFGCLKKIVAARTMQESS